MAALDRRAALLEIGAAGPLAGSALSLVLVLVGLAMAAAGVGSSLPVEPTAFQDSLLRALLGARPSALVPSPILRTYFRRRSEPPRRLRRAPLCTASVHNSDAAVTLLLYVWTTCLFT